MKKSTIDPRRRMVLGTLGLVAAIAGVQAAPTEAAVSAISPATTYSVAGSYQPGCTTVSTSDGGMFGCDYAWQGGASCERGCAGGPQSGTLELSLRGLPNDPYRSCVSKRVSGDLVFHPGDPYLPQDPYRAAVSGRARDSRSYLVSGTFSSGPFAGRRVSALVTLPSDPFRPNDPYRPGCSAGAFSGRLTIR